MKKEFTEQEALGRAAALCSTGEQCLSQIREKLFRWGVNTDAQGRILERLLEEKYIDERRFARAYSLDKFRYSRWGRVKIGMYLRQLDISNADMQYGLSEIPEEEYAEALADLLVSKYRTIKASSAYERKGKLIRFAIGRGFEMDLIMRHLPEDAKDED